MSEQKKEKLAQLVSDLPEIYQPVYGHDELSADVSRSCADRLETVCRVYDALCRKLDRPLRVLDLGCAQGIFSLSLAERGADVFGVDLLDKNIAVCNALAKEHPEFNVQFETGQLEELTEQFAEQSFDLVLCLSVLHHIVHEKGMDTVKQIIDALAESSGMLLVETALREEPLYWAEAQPEDPRTFFENCAFVQETARHPTHLSDVNRPMYAVSNRFWVVGGLCGDIESWTDDPHKFAQGTHQHSRRYFFSPDAVVKKYRFDHERGKLNRCEFEREIAFLATIPEGVSAPDLLVSSVCESEGWVVLQRLPGRLLLELLQDDVEFGRMSVLRSVLQQLAALEAAGLYHNDVRAWNILIKPDGSTILLDTGSISSDQQDCVWPENIFLAFFIFVYELLDESLVRDDEFRPCRMTPYGLPQPYRDWASTLWRYPLDEWSFFLMLERLNAAEDTAVVLNRPLGEWIAAVELALDRQVEFIRYLQWRAEGRDGEAADLSGAVERIEQAAEAIEEKTCKVVADEEKLRARDEKTARQADERAVRAETRSQQSERLAADEAARAKLAEKRAQVFEEELSSARERLRKATRKFKQRVAALEEQLDARASALSVLETERGELQKELQAVEQLLQETAYQLQAATDRLDESTARLDETKVRLHETTAQLHETHEWGQWLESEWNASKQKIDEQNRLLKDERAAAQDLRRQLADVHGSRCVRWTAPLRWVSMQLRRLREEGLFARLRTLIKKIFYLAAHKEDPSVPCPKEEAGDLPEKAAASEAFCGMVVCSSGLFDPEPWGCWSNGKEIRLEFDEALPDHFSLFITAQAFGPNAGKKFVACVGDFQAEFILKNGPKRRVVKMENPACSSVLVLKIPEPTAPADISGSEDQRPLGLGLCQLEIQVGDECSPIDFLGRERYRMSARARKIYHELQREAAAQPARLPADAETQGASRLRLAYVSPLPPVPSGISSYSAELLPILSRHYEIDVIVDQQQVSDEWIVKHCAVRDVQWFCEHAEQFDRVLYHFGNSEFHAHMFDLLQKIPGVVVLHDFFLSGVVCYRQCYEGHADVWREALYHSHGYHALNESYLSNDIGEINWKYPCNLDVIQNGYGVITHSAYSGTLADQWYGNDVSKDWKMIPHLRDPDLCCSRQAARQTLGIGPDDFVVCAFGMLGPAKLNDRLLDAWMASGLSDDCRCRLVFVGENPASEYGRTIESRIECYDGPSRIEITGWADQKKFSEYLAAADVGIQLRTLSRGETSGTVMDCMKYGLATIVNANGSMSELDPGAVWMMPDEFSTRQLIDALETLWADSDRRDVLGRAAREIIMSSHQPADCAAQYKEAVEAFYCAAADGLSARVHEEASHRPEAASDVLKEAAAGLAEDFPSTPRVKQLLVDVSAIIHQDLRTGIQRVVRSVLREWLLNPPDGWRVEPVYASVVHGYLYARRFALEFLGCPERPVQDERVEYAAGDVFLGLDMQNFIQVEQEHFYHRLAGKGVDVRFVVYDLLPILMPAAFPDGAKEQHERWLDTVTAFDGVICISKAVADEVAQWVRKNHPERCDRFRADWFHLGADIDDSVPTKGMPENAVDVLDALSECPGFLMVGTLEPRKAQAQVLAAFECLWKRGVDVNLVLVGKRGWMMKNWIERLDSHPELNRHLFWLEAISDEYLERVYAASDCLLAASLGEGFGLPLIEAAQHGIPIIARDIPVFREVAGEFAFYFDGQEAGEFTRTVEAWLAKYEAGAHPKSDNMPWQTWKQSARQLLDAVLRDDSTEPIR